MNYKLFVPGLWLNFEGPIAHSIRHHQFDVLKIIGEESLSVRKNILKRHLRENPQIDTLVAHSAGCLVVTAALQNGGVAGIKQVVLMNSAPLPGVKFGLKDPTFWAMGKYIPRMILKSPIALTDDDSKNLMSLDNTRLDEVKPSLVEDSGEFIAEVVMGQFKTKPPTGFVQQALGHSNVWTVAVTNDRMIGSCSDKNSWIYDVKPENDITITGGHLTTITQFERTLGILKSHGCRV